MGNTTPVIEVNDLVVRYGKDANGPRAVDGLSFRVEAGECVGFIGANGAGKSTTMKVMMGFMFPSSGGAQLFGLPAGSARSRERIGYLPEVALYYPFMKARELLELYGGLSGLSRAQLRGRIPAILRKVGLGGRDEALLKSFSKGMQQRLGIAQSLIAQPDLLIFDELSSGLDPLGRHDLRQVLLELKQEGRTIFFSSHELSEVESLCDRVIMIHRGKLVTEAKVADLMKPLNEFEILFRPPSHTTPEAIAAMNPQRDGETWMLKINAVEEYSRVLQVLAENGCAVLKTSSRTRSLEEYFIELVNERNTA